MEKEGTMREKNERIGIKVPYTTFLSSRRNDVSGKKMGCRARHRLTASPGVFSVPWVPQVLKRWSQMLIQDYAVPM